MTESAAQVLHAVVLSAGASTRLGTPKQGLTLHGEPLLLRAVRLAREAGAARTQVVIGARAQVDRLALRDSGVGVVRNGDWRSGMASSLACGARAVLAGTADAALVLLVDQYRVDVPDLQRLVAAWRTAPDRPVASRYAGTRGVPAVLPRSALASLAGGGLRGREWLERHAHGSVDLPGAAFDIDVPADVGALQEYERGAG